MPATATPRDRLLQAAAQLFYRDGIGETGVDAVARAAGVSKPTLYAHFAGKAALVAAVLEHRAGLRAGQLQGWVDRIDDVRERPVAVFGWLAAFYEREGERGCAFLNAAAELPGADDPGRRAAVAEKRWLQGFLERLAGEAGAAEPERLASQLLLLVDGVAGRVVVHGHTAAAAAVADAAAAARSLVSAATPP